MINCKYMDSYDVSNNLLPFYSGKIASGKHYRRTTDSIGDRYKTPNYPKLGSYTDEVLRESGMNSPEPTISTPRSLMPEYDWN
jgi:hypothetical protein